MPWVSEEEIQAAKQMSAIEYLRKYESGRLKKSSARNEWELTDHVIWTSNLCFIKT